jgi:hypothetical protein
MAIKRKKLRKASALDAQGKVRNPYLREVLALRRTIPSWDCFFDRNQSVERENGWSRLEVLGEPLAEKYAWAIPDDRALGIIAHFSPLVEIAAGKGQHRKHQR